MLKILQTHSCIPGFIISKVSFSTVQFRDRSTAAVTFTLSVVALSSDVCETPADGEHTLFDIDFTELKVMLDQFRQLHFVSASGGKL